jgi:TPP-dependent 2-oxoacid decarboxylase
MTCFVWLTTMAPCSATCVATAITSPSKRPTHECWDYGKLPEVIGSGRAHRVETAGDLDRALDDARRRDGQFVLLDVRLDKLDVSPALRRLGASLQQAALGQATGNG